MRVFKKSLLIYLLLGVLISYGFGWFDLVNNGWLTGSIIKDISKSISYYFGLVLIYWWIIILVGSLVLSLITVAAYNIYKRLTNAK